MYFYHDRVQRNANDHLHPVLLSDFPADLRIVDAGGIIRHVYRSADQYLQGKLPTVPLWCRDGDRAVSCIVLQPSRLYNSQSEYCQCTRRGRYGWEESVAQDYGDDFFAGPFFRGSEYGDFSYLSDLSADAAPVIIPYMESLGYDFGAYELENPTDIMSEDTQAQWWGSYQPKGFGYYYLNHNKKRLDQTSLRTFNISRYMARKQIEARIDGK